MAERHFLREPGRARRETSVSAGSADSKDWLQEFSVQGMRVVVNTGVRACVCALTAACMNFPYLIPRMNIPYHTLAKERPNLCVEGNCHFKETPPTRNGIMLEWAGGPYLCEFSERYTKLILAPWAPARVPDRALTPNSDPQMWFSEAFSVPHKTNEECPYCLLSGSVSDEHVPDLF